MLLALPCDIEDRYTIVAEIGRGSHAIVYRATDRLLGRDVAVKVLRTELVGSDVGDRFKREIRLTSQLAHPNIAHVYGTGEFQGAPYFVIELARGRSLAERLETEKQLPVDEALAIVRQVASALGHAHRAGIIHRDVKPANILLTPDGALLTDFGVARAIESVAGTLATSTGTAVGTLLYMSPEQLCAEKGIDARSDQYELALVLYELLAGVPPHIAANAEGLRGLRIIGQHAPVRTHRPHVPVSVEQAIDRALCPTPADRFASMAEFVAAMDGGVAWSGGMRVSAAHGTVAVHDAQPPASLARTPMRRWLAPVVAVGALAAAALVAAPRIARARNAVANTAEAGALLAPRFQVAAIGDTTRSAPIARLLVEELSAWPSVEAEVRTGDDGGAGTRLDTRVTNLRDGTQVTVQLRNGSSMRAVQVLLPTGGAQDADSVRLLAGRVLMAGIVSPDSSAPLHVVRERPTAAVRQYAQGWSLLLRGELMAAEQSFSDAARATSVPQAVLWRAIVGSWRQPRMQSAWRDAARAAGEVTQLATRDSLIARAFALRSNDEMVGACDAFAKASRIDGGSFESWYGLGDCLQADSIVVRDRTSPTGFRFRTSYWSSLHAYGESIRRLPSTRLVALFERLPRVSLAMNPSQRTGLTLDNIRMQGFPSVVADSVDVLPMPVTRMRAGGSGTIPLSYQAAVRRGNGRLLELTTMLAGRATGSLDAQLAHARALEYAGMLESPGSQATALSVLRSAATLAATQRDSVNLGIAEARVRLRQADFEGVRHVADRLLHVTDATTPDDAKRLLSLAMIVDRPSVAEALFLRAYSVSAQKPDGLPTTTARAVAQYFVAAARADCPAAESRRAQAFESLRSQYAASEFPGAVEEHLSPGDWMRLVCANSPRPAGAEATDPFIRAYSALRRRDTLAVRRIISAMAQDRDGVSVSSVAWDTRFAETWLLLQSGDSAAARNGIRASVDQLSATMDHVLHDASQGVALRRYLEVCGRITWPPERSAVQDRCARAINALAGA